MKDEEIGFAINEDGTGYVSNKTFMKNVKSEMIDWWFAWHCIGSDLDINYGITMIITMLGQIKLIIF